LTGLKKLWLQDTVVSDAGLKHLKTLVNLETLMLQQTGVTDEGVEELQQALPNCKIARCEGLYDCLDIRAT